MIIAAYVLIAAGVLLFVITPLFATRDTLAQATRRESRRRQLLEDRDMLYEAIRELDFDYRMGKVEEDDYQQTRARYEAQAIDLMKALDKTNGRADRVESAVASDQIESEIAAIRRARNKN